LDAETNICEITTIRIGINEYLADIQVDTESNEAGKESIAVKFILNDGTEYECGTTGSTI
jgi:hypothetical protein